MLLIGYKPAGGHCLSGGERSSSSSAVASRNRLTDSLLRDSSVARLKLYGETAKGESNCDLSSQLY